MAKVFSTLFGPLSDANTPPTLIIQSHPQNNLNNILNTINKSKNVNKRKNKKTTNKKDEKERKDKDNEKESNSIRYKCTSRDCPYGPKGDKFFKKKIFLRNHMKNVHEEKKYNCLKCDKRFGLEWQLKYHEKYCGRELHCGTCRKTYEKPTSMWMHCKRTGHQLPTGIKFKIRTPKALRLTKARNANYLLVPLMIPNSTIISGRDISSIKNSDLFLKNKLILPKTTENLDKNESNESFDDDSLDSLEFELDFIDDNASFVSAANIEEELFRLDNEFDDETMPLTQSTDCQTAQEYDSENNTEMEFTSIQTQTLHSSFDLEGTESDHDSDLVLSPIADLLESNNKEESPSKCSSFTQTLFDFAEINEDFLQQCLSNAKELFRLKPVDYFDETSDNFEELFDIELPETSENFEEAVPVETPTMSTNLEELEPSIQELRNLEPLPPIETLFNCQRNYSQNHFQPQTTGWDHELQLTDFSEFVDIETQTVWNYDQTTQTIWNFDQTTQTDDIINLFDDDDHRDWSDL